jgi:hypothetical protein
MAPTEPGDRYLDTRSHCCGGRPIRPASRSAGKSTSSVHAISAVVPPPSRSSRSRASPTRPPPAVGDEENLQASQALHCMGRTHCPPQKRDQATRDLPEYGRLVSIDAPPAVHLGP